MNGILNYKKCFYSVLLQPFYFHKNQSNSEKEVEKNDLKHHCDHTMHEDVFLCAHIIWISNDTCNHDMISVPKELEKQKPIL
jgi:hypothetical protein